MDVATLAAVVTSITNTLFVIVLAVGYYFTWRVSQRTLAEMKAQRIAIGRPQVIVDDDYDSLPEVNIVIRNVSQGAARDITKSLPNYPHPDSSLSLGNLLVLQ
jgi:hypothetical protein